MIQWEENDDKLPTGYIYKKYIVHKVHSFPWRRVYVLYVHSLILNYFTSNQASNIESAISAQGSLQYIVISKNT